MLDFPPIHLRSWHRGKIHSPVQALLRSLTRGNPLDPRWSPRNTWHVLCRHTFSTCLYNLPSSSPMKNIDETWKAVCVAYRQPVRSFRSWIASERGLAGLRSAADLLAPSTAACPMDHVKMAFSLVLCDGLSPPFWNRLRSEVQSVLHFLKLVAPREFVSVVLLLYRTLPLLWLSHVPCRSSLVPSSVVHHLHLSYDVPLLAQKHLPHRWSHGLLVHFPQCQLMSSTLRWSHLPPN